jgi:hypothetical protein
MNDRDLVVAAAERVMEWPIISGKEFLRHVCEGTIPNPCLEVTDDGNVVLWRGMASDWNPLTDPVASKQLRDKMRADGWNIGIHLPESDNGYKVACLIWKQGGKGESRGESDTEERAVLIAALRAKGVEV